MPKYIEGHEHTEGDPQRNPIQKIQDGVRFLFGDVPIWGSLLQILFVAWCMFANAGLFHDGLFSIWSTFALAMLVAIYRVQALPWYITINQRRRIFGSVFALFLSISVFLTINIPKTVLPDLHLAFTCSTWSRMVSFRIINNEDVVADNPQVDGTIVMLYEAPSGGSFSAEPLQRQRELPTFIGRSSTQFPLYENDKKHVYFDPNDHWRWFIQCYVSCKNNPKQQSYFLAYADTCWYVILNGITIEPESLRFKPDSYLDKMFPEKERIKIPFMIDYYSVL